jgi:cell division protein FtsQ
VRRTRRVRRASAGLTPVRAGALLAILLASAGIYGLASSNAFALRHTTITGATWTPEATILEALALPQGANLFNLEPAALERTLAALPTLRGAAVTVALPDELRVDVAERTPLLVWRTTNGSYLVDADGKLFAELGPDQKEAAASLPVVDDSRLDASVLGVGSTLDPVTLDAATRLGSLSPADVGSAARSLVLQLDDTDGFTMRTRPAGWNAVFGFYTPTLRTTELVPGQVRLLRSILAGREATIQRVILADDRSGTILPRETPEPTRTPRPSKSPKP